MEIYKKLNYAVMSRQEINLKLAKLTKEIQAKIAKYAVEEKQQQRITGFQLLNTALIEHKIDINLLKSIQYNSFGKPFINNEIDYSISYSKNNAVLVMIKNGIVGVDIEQLKEIDCMLYKDYFTNNEWEFMSDTGFKAENFFRLWTRKEAVVKAIGKGFLLALSKIDVINNQIEIDEKTLFLSTEYIENDICFSIASSSFTN